MFPTIAENSKVIIRQQSDVENGEIAAVIKNGDTEVTLKRVKTQGDIMMLAADNPSYGPIIINEVNLARILGKAIKVISDLKKSPSIARNNEKAYMLSNIYSSKYIIA